MPYVVAAAVAVVLLLAEQLRRQHLWYWVPATPWWFLRVCVEGGYALGLTLIFRSIPGLNDTPGLFVGIVAGIAGPRAVGRPALPIRGLNLNLLNVAYMRATKPLDEWIDESSAEVERLYVNTQVRPRARNGELDADAIANAYREHLEGRHLMDDADRLARFPYIDKIMEDDIDNEQKVAALVFRVYQIGAYGALRDQLRELPRRPYGAKRSVENVLGALHLPGRGPKPPAA